MPGSRRIKFTTSCNDEFVSLRRRFNFGSTRGAEGKCVSRRTTSSGVERGTNGGLLTGLTRSLSANFP